VDHIVLVSGIIVLNLKSSSFLLNPRLTFLSATMLDVPHVQMDVTVRIQRHNILLPVPRNTTSLRGTMLIGCFFLLRAMLYFFRNHAGELHVYIKKKRGP
jgi:hypothetical protein